MNNWIELANLAIGAIGLVAAFLAVKSGSRRGVFRGTIDRIQADARLHILDKNLTGLKACGRDAATANHRLIHHSSDNYRNDLFDVLAACRFWHIINDIDRYAGRLPWVDRALWHRVKELYSDEYAKVGVLALTTIQTQEQALAQGSTSGGEDLKSAAGQVRNLAPLWIDIATSYNLEARRWQAAIKQLEMHLIRRLNPNAWGNLVGNVRVKFDLWMHGPRPYSRTIWLQTYVTSGISGSRSLPA